MAKFAPSQLIGANFSFQHVPFGETAKAIRGLGLSEMELWCIAPHLDLFHSTDADVRRLRSILDDNGLTVCCLTPEQVQYPVNIASGDDAYREASIARFCRAADIAVALGAEYLFLTSGRGYESEPAAMAWDRSVEALGRIVDYAAGLGLRCLLEPLQRTESNVLIDAAGLERMLNALGRDTVDVVLDTVAMASAGDTVADYLDRFGPRLAHVHVVDGTPAGHLVWGDGALPLATWLDELAAAGYRGRLSFEPFGDGTYALDPVTAWKRNLAAIEPYLDRG
ncbi:MAG: sugar phosphate isomerase/epimerase family protein [Novosphingobium sp.]